jgi:DnaJ-domain-containing protein 1
MFDERDATARDVPFCAVLGSLYTGKRTGVLSVYDREGSDAVFTFWLKRGYPCFSRSRDGIAPLGEMLGESKQKLVSSVLRRQASGTDGLRQLSGQILLRESVVSTDELQAALLAQVNKRLVSCSARSGLSYRFEDGMSRFADVPLASPLVNPLEVAAMAACTGPLETFFPFAAARVPATHARLSPEKRIPPQVRRHLSPTLLAALQAEERLDRLMEAPSQLRSLTFLLSFDFLEYVNTMPRKQEVSAAQPRPAQTGLERLFGLAQVRACHYELLGLAVDASRDAVRERYRQLALEIHPDRVPAHFAQAARDAFPLIVEAYHTLARERLRTEYDLALFLGDGWQVLGDARFVAECLDRRRVMLQAAGLTNLAREYSRMLAAVSFGPVAAGGWDLAAPGEPIRWTRH